MFFICFVFQFGFGQILFNEESFRLNSQYSYATSSGSNGLSCHDFNLDGLDDITIATDSGHPILFYLNTGNAQFEEIDLNIDNLLFQKQVLWIDFDNDRDLDLYIASFDGINSLYENTGDLIFKEITYESGLPLDTLRTIGANFADFNRDGFLDLFFNTRSIIGSTQGHQNFLYQNNGDGTFTNITLQSNVADSGRPSFCSIIGDFNNDKWPDIYIANDRSSRNTLFINLDGFFADASEISQSGLEMEAMSTTLGDYNNDGYLDLYISNNNEGNKLLKNTSIDSILNTPLFKEVSSELGVEVNSFCWGSLFMDINNDGFLDLYSSSSKIGKDSSQSTLFIQYPKDNFIEHKIGFEADTLKSYSNCFGDFNDDGLIDFLVLNKSPFKVDLWINQQTQNNHWIKINLKGIKSNSNGIGSRVELFCKNEYQQRYNTSAYGFLGQNSGTIHFGIAECQQIDSIKVTWPTGHIDRYFSIDANQTIELFEGQSTDTIFIDQEISLLEPFDADTTQITTVQSLNNSNIDIYPNPFLHFVYINGIPVDSNIKVVGLNGEIIFQDQYSQSLNLEKLNPGIYFLQIEKHNQITTKTIYKF